MKPREVLYDPAVRSAVEGRELAMSCFRKIVEDTHTTVVATVDDEGLPVTSVIDMMDYDEEGLYFLTNVGKSLYQRLVARGYLSLSATDGKPTMECTAVTLAGKVREAGSKRLVALMDKKSLHVRALPHQGTPCGPACVPDLRGVGQSLRDGREAPKADVLRVLRVSSSARTRFSDSLKGVSTYIHECAINTYRLVMHWLYV